MRDSSTEILLEAANFEPFGLLRSSERLKLRTEGSNRWEKGVDPYLAPQAASFATQLLVELDRRAAGWATPTSTGSCRSPPSIRFRPGRADELIGLETPPDEQRAILNGFGFEVDDELERDRADVAQPRRHARGRPDRGDRPRPDGRRPLHAAGAARDVRRLDAAPAPAASRRGRRSPGSASPRSTRRRSCRRRPSPTGWRCRTRWATRRFSGRRSCTAWSTRRRGTPRSGTSGSPCSRSPASTCRSGDELPEEQLHVGGIVEGGFAAVKGVVESLYRALKVELRIERAARPYLYPGRAAQRRRRLAR